VAPTLERLKKYALMSKVQLIDDSDSLVGIGLSGPHCEKELAQVVDSVPAAINDVAQSRDMTVIRTPGIQPRFELYGPLDIMEKTWSRLDVQAAPVGSDSWTLLDVLGGVPTVLPQTVDEFVPQTVNLDLLDGINFKKGCYTGQEIVARVHYRGTVKRRMYLAHCEAPEPPLPGDAVRIPDGEQAIGHVVTAAPDPEGGYLLLASITAESAGEDLRLRQPAGPSLRLRDLPYLRAGAV
jgi:folate-binding protein YgfZ